MNTVIIFGAGATKACGGPLTNEILPAALDQKRALEREGYIGLVEQFLVENFCLPKTKAARTVDHYPALPLLMSLVDISLDRDSPFGPKWDKQQLTNVRDGLEYTIFALLERQLRRLNVNLYQDLLELVYAEARDDVTVISLNYDIIVDNTITYLAERKDPANPGLPDYGCDIATPAYRERARFGTLLKPHGSLNWLYCPNCHRLDIGFSKSGRRFAKALHELYVQNSLEQKYACSGSPCPECSAHVRPVLITPTHLKDYRNPHIARTWYQAARALRQAKRAIFIGYSLPDDDVDVVYLFKHGLANIKPRNITVVEYASSQGFKPLDAHPVGKRFRNLFGPKIDWQPIGFENWVRAHQDRNLSVIRDRLSSARSPIH